MERKENSEYLKNRNRLKILISSHELSPYQGSECSVGWNIITRLGKYHDIIVIYAKTNQLGSSDYEEQIKEYILKNGEIPGVTFIPIYQHKIAKYISIINKAISRDKSIGFPGIYYFCYNLWQKKAYKISKRIISNNKIDIIHHLTSVTFREPGYLWKLNLPFIWGPTGGFKTSTLSLSYIKRDTIYNIIYEYLRYISNRLLYLYSKRISNAISKASLIYLFSREDIYYFKNKERIKPMIDTGCIVNDIKTIKIGNKSNLLSILWCGRLVSSKAPDLFLEILSSLGEINQCLHVKIIGDGNLKNKLIRYAKMKGLNNIEWISNVEHSDIFEYMKLSDVLVHTSYREAASAVILESLSMGLPVICHDISGMAIAINDKCGIKIPFENYNKSKQGFINAIKYLLENRNALNRLKIGAIERARELSWEEKAKTIAEDYIRINYESIANK